MTVPTTHAGVGLEVFASTVNSDGVADISSEQSQPTASRSSFTVRPSSSAPVIALSSSWVAMDGTFDVSGHGFGHNEGVSLALNGITVGTATATSTGILATKAFKVPATDNFGPQTVVASGKINGKPATSGVVCDQLMERVPSGATHTGSEVNDQALNHHLRLSRPIISTRRGASTGGGRGRFGRRRGRCRLPRRRPRRGRRHQRPHRFAEVVDGRSGTSKIDTTPAVVGNLVIIGSVNRRLYALNSATGKVIWTTVLGDAIESSPSASGGEIYVGADNGHVYALQSSNGHVIWTARAAGKVKGSPAVDAAKGLVVVGDGTGVVRAFATATGKSLWEYAAGGAISVSPSIAVSTVYVGSSNGNEYALARPTGRFAGRTPPAARSRRQPRSRVWT